MSAPQVWKWHGDMRMELLLQERQPEIDRCFLQAFVSPPAAPLRFGSRSICCGTRRLFCCPIRFQHWWVWWGKWNLSRHRTYWCSLSVFVRQLGDCLDHTEVPMDGLALTSALHRRGVNVRYLGAILRELERSENKERLNHIQVNYLAIILTISHIRYIFSLHLRIRFPFESCLEELTLCQWGLPPWLTGEMFLYREFVLVSSSSEVQNTSSGHIYR